MKRNKRGKIKVRWVLVLCVIAAIAILIAVKAYAVSYNPVTGNNNLTSPRSMVQYYRGTDGLYYDTGTQPVSGTVTATNIVMVSDSIVMDSMVVNAVAGGETTKTITGVKQIKLKATSAIAVRIATGTGGSTDTTYYVIPSGSDFNLTNLNGISMTLKALGNTDTDTGILSLIIGK